jgi:hypothetical protein
MGCLSDSGMMIRNVTLAGSPVYGDSDVRKVVKTHRSQRRVDNNMAFG